MILGVDMGGTNTRMGLVSEEYQLVSPCRIVKSREFTWSEEPVQTLSKILLEYLTEVLEEKNLSREDVTAVAVSAPASVSNDFCTVYEAPNLKNRAGAPVLNGVPLGSQLEALLGIRCYVNKDVNYLLYYDMMTNNLDGIVVGCYIGTGLGSAVSIDGKMLYGRHGFAMDCGHLPFYRAEGICGCGKQGCAETISSGIILQKIREEYFPDTPFEELFTRHGEEEILTEFVRDCAYVPASLLTVFDPSAIVLGGGVIEMKDFPKMRLEKEILARTEKAVASDPPVFCYADYLPERGVIGAACFVSELEKG